MKYALIPLVLIILFILFLLKDEASFRNEVKKIVKDFEKDCVKHIEETENDYFKWQTSTVREFLDDLDKLTIQCHDVKELKEKYKKRLADIAEVWDKAKSTNH